MAERCIQGSDVKAKRGQRDQWSGFISSPQCALALSESMTTLTVKATQLLWTQECKVTTDALEKGYNLLGEVIDEEYAEFVYPEGIVSWKWFDLSRIAELPDYPAHSSFASP